MSKQDDGLFGWELTFGEHHDGKPFVEGRKEGFAMMGERGEVGIDPEIMVQRLLPRLFEQEVERAAESKGGVWRERLQAAIDARDDARVIRRERALREQAREMAKAEKGGKS